MEWVISGIAVVLVFVLGALGIDVAAKVLVVLITLESSILLLMGIHGAYRPLLSGNGAPLPARTSIQERAEAT